MKRIWLAAGFVMIWMAAAQPADAFDHGHTEWDGLLKSHVHWNDAGTETVVDYAGFQKDAARLNAYLSALSAVASADFEGWSADRQLAFLINAYNAFTVKLILTRYPDLTSIKDIGSLFKSPWKIKFFSLLGEERHLDWLEHEMIRKPGWFDDPRIHAAVNCASIGCPALRDAAFVAPRLDLQLTDGMQRFLKDRTRNRYNPDTDTLEVSKIFDWYREDFEKGYRGITSLKVFFADHADLLADDPAHRKRIRAEQVPIDFLPYDWDLNAAG